MNTALDRLKNLTSKISSYETTRKKNLVILEKLYREIGVDEKVDEFFDIFDFKAINLSGASLLKENMGEIKKGKYLQILAISYDKNAVVKSKNSSLGYYGKSESVDEKLKDKIVEFIIRYRFEKSFITLENYNDMIGEFKPEDE